jgi:hypothetical protein
MAAVGKEEDHRNSPQGTKKGKKPARQALQQSLSGGKKHRLEDVIIYISYKK